MWTVTGNMTSITWFEKLFGFEEFGAHVDIPSSENYTRNQYNFHVEVDQQDEGNMYVVSHINRKRYCVGSFDCLTLQQLRRVVLTPLLQQSSAPSRGESPASCVHISVDDILEMHVDNPGATFQTASQLNCLEFSSPSMVPEHGLTCYMHDNTQGPACSLACAAATVYRNYFTPVRGQGSPTCRKGQTADMQLNNLKDLELLLDNERNRYWSVRNGYVFSDEDSLSRLNRTLDERGAAAGRDELMECIMVGVQANAEVTFASRFVTPDEVSGLCPIVNYALRIMRRLILFIPLMY